MGEPAVMTSRDRSEAKQAAQSIYDSVVNESNPASALIAEAKRLGVPPETVILWLAQLALEVP